MHTIYKLPATLQADLDRLRDETERFRSGETSAAEYRSFRVPQGVYEQRQEGAFMLRVRLPAGGLLPEQMRKLAAVARKFGSGRLHVTTRQDIQVHDVPLEGIHPALVELRAVGLSTKGGGGNTVRNITACPDAGVCAQEVFDVSPHAVALTEFMLSDPVSFQLPRKYKIAFSGCSADCIGATVNDLGFIARQGADGPGCTVYAGGGMGPHARVGELLEEFVPIAEVHLVAEAVKRAFDKHGNRKNKHRARLRYLIEDKGFEGFKELYETELSRLRQEASPALQVRELNHQCPIANPQSPIPNRRTASHPSDGFDTWHASNVSAQKQEGYHLVHVPLFLGELPADTLEKLADVVENYGEGMVRTTPSQNLIIRWVSAAALPGLHRGLSTLDLAGTPPPVLREAIACTGAATCKLGICLSQGLARAIHDELESRTCGMPKLSAGMLDGTQNMPAPAAWACHPAGAYHPAGLDLEDAVDLRLYINGCPNACGRHPIASIGLFGAARRVDDRLVPHYVLQLGGRVGEGKTRLAEGKEVVPARNVPAFLVEFLRAFRESAQYPDFTAFLESGGRETAVRIAARHKDVPPFARDRNYYYDWGAEELFSLAGRGPGECSAGVFDLISVDLASARQAREEGKLLTATGLAARALLITRGEEARDTADALRLFEKHFVDAGLVEGSFRDLIASAVVATPPSPLCQGGVRGGDRGTEASKEFAPDPARVSALIAAVENLYENMDQSLRFHPAPHAPAAHPTEPRASARAKSPPPEDTYRPPVARAPGSDRAGYRLPEEMTIDREADFTGITCPLNYVKTKLLLGQMRKGQVLSVLLDEAGARSVPQSAEKDGHEVLSEQKEGDRWRVIIRKA